MSAVTNAETPPEVQRRKPANIKSRIILVFIFLVIAALIIAGVWRRRGKTDQNVLEEGRAEGKEKGELSVITLDEEARKKIDLTLEPAQYRDTFETIQITGVVGPNQTWLAHLRPLARGRIEEVYVRVGDHARTGQPLVTYDNIELGELISEHATAKAALEKATADAQVNKRSVERGEKLIELGAVAKAEQERRVAEYKSALASIDMQKAQVAMIEQKMRRFGVADADIKKLDARDGAQPRGTSRTILRSPFNGIVIKTDAAKGETVDQGRELLTLANLSTVWVQGDVYEKDIASIRRGQEVNVLADAYPDRTFTGRLTYLSDVLDPQTRTAKIRCELPNPKGMLKLEMFVTIRVPTSARRKALMIPAAALQQFDNESVVFVEVAENRFEKRKVEPGTKSDGRVEVRRGLKQGEKVVTQGSFMLKSQLKKKEFGEVEEKR